MLAPQFSSKFNTVRWGQRTAALNRNTLRAERENAESMRQTAIKLSSGPYSTQWQRQQARSVNKGRGLYSKASPMPPGPDYVINAQGSGFDSMRNHWQTRIVIREDGTSITLWNSSGHAKYLLGGEESSMIPRPLLQEVARLEAPGRLKRLAQAKAASLKV